METFEFTVNATSIIAFVGVITALGTLLTIVLRVHKWVLKQEKQDKDIASMKTENQLIMQGVCACLDGLEQLKCNHSVPETRKKIQDFLNEKAHE